METRPDMFTQFEVVQWEKLILTKETNLFFHTYYFFNKTTSFKQKKATGSQKVPL